VDDLGDLSEVRIRPEPGLRQREHLTNGLADDHRHASDSASPMHNRTSFRKNPVRHISRTVTLATQSVYAVGTTPVLTALSRTQAAYTFQAAHGE
jgi:hypothetical protein